MLAAGPSSAYAEDGLPSSKAGLIAYCAADSAYIPEQLSVCAAINGGNVQPFVPDCFGAPVEHYLASVVEDDDFQAVFDGVFAFVVDEAAMVDGA